MFARTHGYFIFTFVIHISHIGAVTPDPFQFVSWHHQTNHCGDCSLNFSCDCRLISIVFTTKRKGVGQGFGSELMLERV